MKTNEVLSQSAHEEVWVLLPWYVNQTLSNDEHDLVEQHLKTCVSCRSELAIQKKLSEQVYESTTDDVCEQVQYSQLLKKIHAEPANIVQRQTTFFSRIGVREWATAAVVLVVLSLSFTGLHEPTDVDYRTLSNTSMDRVGKINDIRVIFEDSLDDAQRQVLLKSVNARIVEQAGTTADSRGVYIIRMSEPSLSTANEIVQDNRHDANRVIEHLRQQPGIIFAEPFVTAGT
jgi:hypothetical protein